MNKIETSLNIPAAVKLASTSPTVPEVKSGPQPPGQNFASSEDAAELSLSAAREAGSQKSGKNPHPAASKIQTPHPGQPKPQFPASKTQVQTAIFQEPEVEPQYEKPGTSIGDQIKDWWCDSLNLETACRRQISRAESEINSSHNGFIKSARKHLETIDDMPFNDIKTACQELSGPYKTAAQALLDSPQAGLRTLGREALQLLHRVQERQPVMVKAAQNYKTLSGSNLHKLETGAAMLRGGLQRIPKGGDAPLQSFKRGLDKIDNALNFYHQANPAGLPLLVAGANEIKSLTEHLIQVALPASGQTLSDSEQDQVKLLSAGIMKLSQFNGTVLKTAEAVMAQDAENAGHYQSEVKHALEQTWNNIARNPDNKPLTHTCIHSETKDFLLQGNEFRSILQDARQGDLEANLALKAKWGYTLETLPQPGSLFVDPYFMNQELPQGQIAASRFPAATSNPVPVSVEQQLFGTGKNLTFPETGKDNTVIRNFKHYRNFVAQNRKAAGIQDNSEGHPLAMHISLKGGGGMGKRYPSALEQSLRLGIVPASLSGTSVGAIAAALVAAGADPAMLHHIMKDERLGKLLDAKLGGAGIMKGEEAYKLIDGYLRDITGIHDRPVTFADLKVPLQIIAGIYADSAPPEAKADFSKPENRVFTFSQATTPNTSVALAVRASMAIPGVFEPVEMSDPVTGRSLLLVDGGILENLPLAQDTSGLPTLAFSLTLPNRNHPEAFLNKLPTWALSKDKLYTGNPILNIFHGAFITGLSGKRKFEYQFRFTPPPNTFVFHVPAWNLEKPSERDSILGMAYDPKIDPKLDVQTAKLCQEFIRDNFKSFTVPGASASNLKPLAQNRIFNIKFRWNNQDYSARYDGSGNKVIVTSPSGEQLWLKAAQTTIENWIIDNSAFNDLSLRIKEYLAEGKLVHPKPSTPAAGHQSQTA